jgi:hypothetical protein
MELKKTELKWFESYLHDRSQIVYHNNVRSKNRKINIGVPQGTILGPVLFLLYINDLSNCVQNAQINIFADDVVVYSSHKCINKLNENLQSTLEDVFRWYTRNKLSLSLEKCNTMVINAKTATPITDFHVKLGDINLEQVDSAKYLGLTLDDKLKWNHHLSTLAKKINFNNTRLRRIRHILPLNTRLKLHNAINVPLIDYASTVCGDFSTYVNNFITKLEHRCARALTGNYDYIHTRGEHLMTELNMSNYLDRLKLHKTVLIYKAIHGLAPDFLLDYITFKFEIMDNSLRSCNNSELYIPKPENDKFKKSLLYSGPKLWNTLPLNIRKANSISEFKRLYKETYPF